MALHTLRAMGEGGMFDQLGGGFHRYSVDERWLVSHFEKMLYDQAQLVTSYVDAYQITHDPFYADIARRTCDYVLRDMTSPDGGFYSAEDADSEGVEGKFYVWTREEIDKSHWARTRPTSFCRAYGVDRGRQLGARHERAARGARLRKRQAFHNSDKEVRDRGRRAKLFAAREKRVRPHRDEKSLDRVERVDDFRVGARGAGARRTQISRRGGARGPLSRGQSAEGRQVDPHGDGAGDGRGLRVSRQWPGGFVRSGLRSAVVGQGHRTRRHDARAVLRSKEGGFFQTDGRDPSVIVRAKEDYDGAEPSGNSMAALLLLRLAQFTDRANYREAAEKTLQLFGDHLHKAPSTVPQMLCVLDFYLSKPKQIVIAGKADAADTRAMLRAVRERYLPNAIVILADGGESQKTLTKLLPFLETIKPMDGKATAYVCVNYACQLPTNDIDKLIALLES